MASTNFDDGRKKYINFFHLMDKLKVIAIQITLLHALSKYMKFLS